MIRIGCDKIKQKHTLVLSNIRELNRVLITN